MSNATRNLPAGPAIMAVGALAALIISLIGYLLPTSGIRYTGGALLVVGSSACLLVAAILEMIGWVRRHWPGPTLTVLIILGIAGTAAAAYFLEAWWLEAAMAVTFAGWLVHLFRHPRAGGERPVRDTEAEFVREPPAMQRRQMHGAHS